MARVLAQPFIGLDQTSWKRLDDNGKKPWQMWCLTAPGCVVHRILKDKSEVSFRALVSDYRVIVCYALGTHAAGIRGSDGVALAGCWAHLCRKFEDAAKDHPESDLAMKWLAELHDIDAEAEGDDETKLKVRRRAQQSSRR